MDFLTDPIFTEYGRSDFIGGIDNEALDFGHLEQFIHVAGSTGGGNVSSTVPSVNVNDVLVSTSSTANNNDSTQSHLPESPPDSSSEPPFSPADIHGLTLTSRATSNYNAANDGSLIDADSSLGTRQHIKPASDLHGLTHTSNQQHQHSHNIHNHQIFVDHNDQHSLLLSSTPHLHQQIQHTEPNTSASPTTGSDVIYSSGNNHPDHARNHTENLLVIDSHHRHQQPHANNNLHLPAMSDVVEHIESRNPYSRQNVMLTPHHQHIPPIIPSDVYMGTPGPIIEPTADIVQPTLKRKLSQVDFCASTMTIKPEPGASLSPMLQHNLCRTSPVSINLQQISSGGAVGSISPSSLSLSPTGTSISLSNDNSSLDGGGTGSPAGVSFVGSNATDSSSESLPMQCIRFSPFQQHTWHTLCDQSLQELTMAHYRVDADKGFNFSVSDDAFVCQKKNHFQITCHARLQGEAKFVKTSSGLEKIKSFHLHFYGVKLEAPNQTIRVEQSQSDRSKKPFHPVPIDLQSHLVSKVTVGRLHFSETTNNNMRKKGRPNPEQRYFQLVVGLHAHTHSGHYPVISQGSERIIVRASNPGQFESDVELCWQRGVTPESVFHAGRVGINTDRPDESLVIHGNLKVSGHIIQPSDSRAKQEISELDTSVQLKNLQRIRIVRYRYEPEFAMHSGLKPSKNSEDIIDTGVIAQELREVLPDAVQEAGSIILPSGQVIDNFLLVNKDRILMENIGAVKELCKVTGSLETRIEQLEKINNRLLRIQENERSKKCSQFVDGEIMDGEDELCSNRTIQMMIIILVIIMATCLVAVSTLYFVEHSKQRYIKRYDRYDFSQHNMVSHDAVLVHNNNNNNNQINLNHNDYNMLKNGKIILQTHTARPPIIPAIPQPIQPQILNFPQSRQSTSFPTSVIASSYPSVRGGSGTNFRGSYIHSEDFSAITAERPIESPGGIEKPDLPGLIPIVATHLNNKTASSKNKSKWPLSDATISPLPTITASYKINEEENFNMSETSSEKVADSIPQAQDFENNSIDGADTSQKPEALVSSQKIITSIAHESISESTAQVNSHDAPENNVLDALSVSVAGVGIGTLKIDTTGDHSSTSSSSSTSFIIYKNIKGKSNNDTISEQVNYTIETPSISNKSQSFETEETDLQNLGNSNNSDDQSLTDADMLVVPIVSKIFALPPIGIPDHCIKIEREEISNCQSACFEESNSLTSQNSESEIKRNRPQKKSSNNFTILETDHTKPFLEQQSMLATHENLPSNKNNQAVDVFDVQVLINPQQTSQQSDGAKRDEGVLLLKEKKTSHKDPKWKIESIVMPASLANDQKISAGCSTVSLWLHADTFNVSLGYEEICLNGRSSLNISYLIPISKYLKDTNIELIFVAPVNLIWAVCSNKEITKRDGNCFVNSLNNGKVFQKSQNVSIFYLNIPGHGHFERLIELRAFWESNKNICREQIDETKVLLQYNIRIVRDCD